MDNIVRTISVINIYQQSKTTILQGPWIDPSLYQTTRAPYTVAFNDTTDHLSIPPPQWEHKLPPLRVAFNDFTTEQTLYFLEFVDEMYRPNAKLWTQLNNGINSTSNQVYYAITSMLHNDVHLLQLRRDNIILTSPFNNIKDVQHIQRILLKLLSLSLNNNFIPTTISLYLSLIHI